VPKIVRTDGELELPHVDRVLRESGADLVVLPDAVTREHLTSELRDAELLLMCYTPVPAQIIESARRLKGIVKYGVGIDAIDIDAARRRRIPIVNVPEYAEETVAEGALALMILLDQFPRNCFRGTGHMYATDSLARFFARKSVAAAHHQALEPELGWFFVLPFLHSESLGDQEFGVEIARPDVDVLQRAVHSDGALDQDQALPPAQLAQRTEIRVGAGDANRWRHPGLHPQRWLVLGSGLVAVGHPPPGLAGGGQRSGGAGRRCRADA